MYISFLKCLMGEQMFGTVIKMSLETLRSLWSVWVRVPPLHSVRQHMIPQVFGVTVPIWEIQMKFLAINFSQVQPQLLQAFGKLIIGPKTSISIFKIR